jgi:hypothetical protein
VAKPKRTTRKPAKTSAKKSARKRAPSRRSLRAKPARKPSKKRAVTAQQETRQFDYVLVPVDDVGFARGSVVQPLPAFEAPERVQPAPWSTRVETPFAERAGGAGMCAQCRSAIGRGDWQVVVTDDGATIHPGCAFAWTQEHLEDQDADDWMSSLVEHLSEADRAELLSQLTPR